MRCRQQRQFSYVGPARAAQKTREAKAKAREEEELKLEEMKAEARRKSEMKHAHAGRNYVDGDELLRAKRLQYLGV